jgi:hypothetical protein
MYQLSSLVESFRRHHPLQGGVQISTLAEHRPQVSVAHLHLDAAPLLQATTDLDEILIHIDQEACLARGHLGAIELALDPYLPGPGPRHVGEGVDATALGGILVVEGEGAQVIAAIAVMMTGVEVEAALMEEGADAKKWFVESWCGLWRYNGGTWDYLENWGFDFSWRY